jgi:shikimate kinase
MSDEQTLPDERAGAIRARLGARSVVLVGLMGAGKSTVGRKLDALLGLPFHDADGEIEAVSRMTIPELFETYGEPEFRDLERRVIARMLDNGPLVLATGGGAFIQEQTRSAIAEQGISVWLDAELDLLMERVGRRQNRPLLQTSDPRAVMQKLMAERYPVYATAEIRVRSRDVKKEVVALEVIDALDRRLVGDQEEAFSKDGA